MKTFSFLKSKIFISILGIISLSIIFWFISPLIKFGDSNSAPFVNESIRLIVILFIVAVWAIINLIKQNKNRINNNKFIDELDKNDFSEKEDSNDILQIQNKFTEALETLKKIRFNVRGRKKALYELPWYIIIGPPGSGKTTALVNSSLEFPLSEEIGKVAMQGVGGTRNCDWWFTDEAVLIDTAGRYITQDSHRVNDSNAWFGFLSLLKKNRRRRPINGVIIAISFLDLMQKSDEERKQYAKTIRERIDELTNKLDIRFPIYFVFTKSDLLPGFSEFFGDLSKEERHQVWGVSLPNEKDPTSSPDFDYLSKNLKRLIERLNERVLSRMQQESDLNRRILIRGFPSQLEKLKSCIDNFIFLVFSKNRYNAQPFLRGIYFTSGTQDGTSIDRLMSSVSNDFGLPNQVENAKVGKSYFIGNLFQNIIFPEAELVGSNHRYEVVKRWIQNLSYSAIGITFVIFLFSWSASFTQHKILMSEVKRNINKYANNISQIKDAGWDLENLAPILNDTYNASIVYDREEHPWLSNLGLYDANVDNSADRLYKSTLEKVYFPVLIKDIERNLQSGERNVNIYDTFKVYMMFNKSEYMDKEYVSDWYQKHWKKIFYKKSNMRENLSNHLDNFLNLNINNSTPDSILIQQVRNIISRVPTSKRMYSRIKYNKKYTKSVNLRNYFGLSINSGLNSKNMHDMKIPYIFTKRGYRSIDFSVNSTLMKSIKNDAWMLSDEGSTDFLKEDLNEIAQKVKQHYLDEYSVYWSNILDNINVTEFSGLNHANDVLLNMLDPVYSPLISILQTIKDNTQLTPPISLPDNKLKDTIAEKFQSANHFETSVDKRFKRINTLSLSSNKQQPHINIVMGQIKKLHDLLNEISSSPDPDKKAFEIAKSRFVSNNGNALTSLRYSSKNMPTPVKRWLLSLADQSWKVILQSSHRHIKTVWSNKVYSVYKRGLAGRYPLTRNTMNELAVYDFSEFFRPNGIMDRFFINYIKPFIRTDKGWKYKFVDSRNLQLSRHTILQIKKSQKIKNIYFKNNPEVPSVKFQLKPFKMGKKNARFILEMGNKRIVYNHGPKFWKTVTWSGNEEESRTRLIFEDLNEQLHIKVYEGSWAWFRLQDQSTLTKTRNANTFFINYNIDNDLTGNNLNTLSEKHNITFQIKAKSVNNPFNRNLLSTFAVSERI